MTTIMAADAAVDGFLEDKDFAADKRERVLKPAMVQGVDVVVDFEGVHDVSQSFIHALIAEVLRNEGRPALGRIRFRNANDPVRDAIRMVIRYTLSGGSTDGRNQAS